MNFDFLILIGSILPVFIIIGCGYFAAAGAYINKDHRAGFIKFTQNFAIPALLFHAAANIDIERAFEPTLLISFYFGVVVAFIFGIFGARFFFARAWQDAVVIGFCAMFSNSLLLGLTITEQVYGANALESNYAIISIHSLFLYFIGISAMEIVQAQKISLPNFTATVFKKLFGNMLIIAIIAGYCVNILGLRVPAIIDDALLLLAGAALPLALFGLGGTLSEYRPEGDMRVILYICCLSIILHPALTYAMATFFALPDNMFRSAVLMASMPSGVNAYMFAAFYGRAMRVAASAVLFGTIFSIITSAIWISTLP